MTNNEGVAGEPRLTTGVAAALFGLVAVLSGADLLADMSEGTTMAHVISEGVVLILGLLGLSVTGRRFLALARRERILVADKIDLAERLEATHAEATRWRSEARELSRGLGESIDMQLDRWRLTPAEQEVALLLLKGLSFKEIAEVRQVSEATARQQARALYRKAGLAGRSELAAFFLEDLLAPRTQQDA